MDYIIIFEVEYLLYLCVYHMFFSLNLTGHPKSNVLFTMLVIGTKRLKHFPSQKVSTLYGYESTT